MPTFTSGNGQFTPATTQDNYTLDSQSAGVFAKVVAIAWGGSLTTSTGYRTRWTRPTAAGSSTTIVLTLAPHQPNYTTAGARVATFSTVPTLATDPSSNLFATDWNAQGGLGMVVLPLANPWWIINGVQQGQISCRNTKGTDASGSSYEVTWEE